MVAIAEGCTEWSNNGVIVVGNLSTNECAVIQYVLEFVGLLTCCNTQEDVVILGDSLLGLKLCGKEVIPHVFHIAYACEGHLLFDIVSEPLTADGITKNGRYDSTEEQAAIEHGLDGEAATYSEGHTPVGFKLTHAGLFVGDITVGIADIEFGEVVGNVGVFSIEACTTCGEVPAFSLL